MGTLRPRALARSSTCFGERMRLGEDVVAREPEADSAASAAASSCPGAHGAAGRERVAGHEVAVLQGVLGLIVQRLADVLDRVDQVQAVGEQLQVAPSRPSRASASSNCARSSSGPVCAGQIGRAGQKRQWSPRSRRGRS